MGKIVIVVVDLVPPWIAQQILSGRLFIFYGQKSNFTCEFSTT